MRLAALFAVATLAFATAPARAADKPRIIQLEVTGDGFVPDEVKVKAGEPLQLVITRKTDRTCATEIVIKDYGIDQKLPLNQAVTVAFTPRKAGKVRYACGMDMIAGQLVVE
jgi:plastocyanin domain-containing protein